MVGTLLLDNHSCYDLQVLQKALGLIAGWQKSEAHSEAVIGAKADILRQVAVLLCGGELGLTTLVHNKNILSEKSQTDHQHEQAKAAAS